jgi:hypothetical protein
LAALTHRTGQHESKIRCAGGIRPDFEHIIRPPGRVTNQAVPPAFSNRLESRNTLTNGGPSHAYQKSVPPGHDSVSVFWML